MSSFDPAGYIHQRPERARERYWVHAALLLLTLVTTTVMGARLVDNFQRNMAPFSDDDLDAFARLIQQPSLVLEGLPFSLTLVAILMAHEMGHYLACVYYRIDASLPYFLPAPTLIGTLGAFIRIRSSIGTRKELFDVGIAGPIAGFVFLLPALFIGVAYSKVIPEINLRGDLAFGVPPLLGLAQQWLFPGTAEADVYLHPVGRAAWVGLLATALNLLPIGQLDGGHILYAYAGRWHKRLTYLFLALLIPLGVVYSVSWIVWAVILFLFARKHPRIHDREPLGGTRAVLALLSVAIFLCAFTVTPISILDVPTGQ